MLFSPVYRLTLYTRAGAVVTPIPGAIHSDPFRVATAEGVSGYKPYLGIPRGTRGQIDPLSNTVSSGQYDCPIFDVRTTAGGPNSERWMTAFLGDTKGAERLKGCKAVIEESLNGGSTWKYFFTGYVQTVTLNSLLEYSLTIEDVARDLDHDIFVGPPHTSISYAGLTHQIPNGSPVNFGTITGNRYLSGSIGPDHSRYTQHVNSFRTDVAPGTRVRGHINVTETRERPYRYVSRRMTDLGLYQYGPLTTVTKVKVFMRQVGETAWKLFHSAFIHSRNDGSSEYPFAVRRDRNNLSYLTAAGIESPFKYTEKNADGTWNTGSLNPAFSTIPAAGTAVQFFMVIDEKPTKEFPLFIGDVHPVQLWRDILDGKFGLLDSVTGEPEFTVAYDSGSFATLVSDTSFPKMRFLIEEKEKMNEFIEEQICKPLNLTYAFNGEGKVVPIDMRPKNLSVASLPIITDENLATDSSVTWETNRQSAITKVEVNFYKDKETTVEEIKDNAEFYYLTSGLSFIDSVDVPVVTVNLRDEAEIGSNVYKVDARGFRTMDSEAAPNVSGGTNQNDRANWLIQNIQEFSLNLKAPFGGGAQFLDVPCRRSGSAVEDCWLGNFRIINVSPTPNTAANLRGGQRLGLCIRREEKNSNVILSFLDMGTGTVAVTPSLSAVTASANAVTASVTLNAQSEPVTVHYLLTDTSVTTRPAEADARWTFGLQTSTSGPVVVSNLPFGARVWLRARSVGSNATRTLPSAYVYPASPGYVTLPALTSPSGVSVSGQTISTADVTWTNGDAIANTEILLVQGAAPSAWSDGNVIATLPAGSTRYTLTGLSGPTVQYTLGVRHKSAEFGLSAVASATFNTGTSQPVSPTPLGIKLATPVD